MKTLLALAILLLSFAFNARAQHEYAPLQEQQIEYKNWTYKAVRDGKEINLRDFAKNKKLVMVVYFAAWCPNWKLEAPVAQALYDKYKSYGFDVVGVSEYASLEDTKANLDELKITFNVVAESEAKELRDKTLLYEYRQITGDTRRWGSPWNIFLEPANLEKDNNVLTKKTFVVNGELIEDETEKFIRQKLGLPIEEKKIETSTKEKTIEACEPKKKTETLNKP